MARYQHGQCGLCAEPLSDKEAFLNHLVEKHGYLRFYQTAYKRHLCRCGKPGLYQKDRVSYCREHRPELAIGLSRGERG